MKRYIAVSLSLILVLVFSACTAETVNPNDQDQFVDSDQPLPVEPDGGIGGPSGEDLPRGHAQVDRAELLILESYPVQVSLHVSGTLPSPCYDFGYQVSQPDADNQIFVEVYSLEARTTCDMPVQPFDENISLPVAGLPDGIYTVYVNGERVGEFSYPG